MVGPSKQASTLVWGLLRLTPISSQSKLCMIQTKKTVWFLYFCTAAVSASIIEIQGRSSFETPEINRNNSCILLETEYMNKNNWFMDAGQFWGVKSEQQSSWGQLCEFRPVDESWKWLHRKLIWCCISIADAWNAANFCVSRGLEANILRHYQAEEAVE